MCTFLIILIFKSLHPFPNKLSPSRYAEGLQLASNVLRIFSKMRVSTELYRDGLCAQDSVTDVSNPFSRYRTQWGKSPRAVAGMEWEEIGLTLDT